MKNEDQLPESSRNAEMKEIDRDLEQRLREQQKATLDWKVGLSKTITTERYDHN